MNHPRQPQKGLRISERIIVPDGARWGFAHATLQAIDRVHRDGELPLVPLESARSRDAGGFLYSSRDGRALRIEVRLTAAHPDLTLVHEIGHFIDRHALGALGSFGSEAGVIGPLMDTIGTSASIRNLTKRAKQKWAIITLSRGGRYRESVDPNEVQRLLYPEEQFARAYAQYIATCGDLAAMLHQLKQKRRNALAQQVYYEQWADDDFEPIARAFDALFREKGWIV